MRYRSICAFAVLLTLVGPAMGETRETAMFDVRLLGLTAGELWIKGRRDGARYAVSGALGSTGLLAMIREVSYEAAAAGKIRNGVYIPDWYKEIADTGRRRSEAQMGYLGGVPQVKTYRPARPPQPQDVDPASQGGTVDPLTALYAALRDVDGAEACRLSLEIFDGRRASRVDLRPGETGPDRRTCTGAYRRVAGYSDEDLAERTVFPFEMRLEPLGDGRWRVMEVSLQTLYGKVRLVRQ